MRTGRTEENATRSGGRFSISETVLIKLARRYSSVRRKNKAESTTTTIATKKPVRDCDYNCSACTQSKHKTADEGSTAQHDDSHALSLYLTGRATSSTLYYSVTCALPLSLFLARTQAHKCLISIGIFWRWRCCGDDCEWQRRRSNSSDSSSGSDVSVCCACT